LIKRLRLRICSIEIMPIRPPRLPLSSLGSKEDGDHDEGIPASAKGSSIFSVRGRERNVVVPFTEDGEDGVDVCANQQRSSSTSRVSSVLCSAARAASAAKATWSSISSPRISPRVLSTRGAKYIAPPQGDYAKKRGGQFEPSHASGQASPDASLNESSSPSQHENAQEAPTQETCKSSSSPCSSKEELSQHTSPIASSSRSHHDVGHEAEVRTARSWWKRSSSNCSLKGHASTCASPKAVSSKTQHESTWDSSVQDTSSKRKSGSSRYFSRATSTLWRSEEATHAMEVDQTGATFQAEADEVQGLTNDLLNAVYGEMLTPDIVSTIKNSCPEVEWLAQCGIGAPLPKGWIRKGGRKGACYINAMTGEELQVMPQFSNLALLARLVLRAKQSEEEAYNAMARVEALRDNIFEDACTVLKDWSGPHIDPSSGAEFFYCEAKGESSWTNPMASETYMAHVADRLLQSDVFLGATAEGQKQRRIDETKQEGGPAVKEDPQKEAHQLETQNVQTNVRDLLEQDLMQKVFNIRADVLDDRKAAVALADAAAAIAAAAAAIAGADRKGPAVADCVQMAVVDRMTPHRIQTGAQVQRSSFQTNAALSLADSGIGLQAKTNKVEHFKIDSGSEGEEEEDSGDDSDAESRERSNCKDSDRQKSDMEIFMRQRPVSAQPISAHPPIRFQGSSKGAAQQKQESDLDVNVLADTGAGECVTTGRPAHGVAECDQPDTAQPGSSQSLAAPTESTADVTATAMPVCLSGQLATKPPAGVAGAPASLENSSTSADQNPMSICMPEFVSATSGSRNVTTQKVQGSQNTDSESACYEAGLAPITLESSMAIEKSKAPDRSTLETALKDDTGLPTQGPHHQPKTQDLPPLPSLHLPGNPAKKASHPKAGLQGQQCEESKGDLPTDGKCKHAVDTVSSSVQPAPTQLAVAAHGLVGGPRPGTATAPPPPPPPTGLPVKHVPVRTTSGASVAGGGARQASPSQSRAGPLPWPVPPPPPPPGPSSTADSKLEGGMQDGVAGVPIAVGGA